MIKMILELIYEPTFSHNSHGFRPNKSCHTCLNQINKNFKGVRYIIEGDINAAFDSIDHKILLDLLSQRINDVRFLNLIRMLLKAGYLEQTKVLIKPLTRKKSIVSSLFSNIYLHELDIFIENIQNEHKSQESQKSFV